MRSSAKQEIQDASCRKERDVLLRSTSGGIIFCAGFERAHLHLALAWTRSLSERSRRPWQEPTDATRRHRRAFDLLPFLRALEPHARPHVVCDCSSRTWPTAPTGNNGVACSDRPRKRAPMYHWPGQPYVQCSRATLILGTLTHIREEYKELRRCAHIIRVHKELSVRHDGGGQIGRGLPPHRHPRWQPQF